MVLVVDVELVVVDVVLVVGVPLVLPVVLAVVVRVALPVLVPLVPGLASVVLGLEAVESVLGPRSDFAATLKGSLHVVRVSAGSAATEHMASARLERSTCGFIGCALRPQSADQRRATDDRAVFGRKPHATRDGLAHARYRTRVWITKR